MLTCDDVSPLLDALLDDELDMVNRLAIEKHLQGCTACKEQYAALSKLQQQLQQQARYYKAPAELQQKIATLEKDTAQAKPYYQRRWLPSAMAAGIALLLSVGIVQFDRQSQRYDSLRNEIIAGHVRSLMAEHLTDVTSSDRHTVKPWFNSRIDFSPSVYDFTADGFPLVGGRLDYIQNHNSVALVYRRRQHIINMYTWPTKKSASSDIAVHEQQGYRILSWHQQGMTYWAISDLNLHDMRTFAELIKRKNSSG